MIERWTIDSIAAEVESQFKGADPVPKLLRKFYKEGRRQGRRGMSPDHMRQFLENVIELATSKIAEDYLDEKAAHAAELAARHARQVMLKDDIDGASSDPTELDPGAAHDNSTSTGLSAPSSGPDLNASLSRLKAIRAAREAAANEARRRAEIEQIEQQLDQIDEQVAVTEQTVEDLPDKYRQLVESCHETGELMWSRYRLGYLRGDAKRGTPDPEDGNPEQEIEFEYPEVLDKSQEVEFEYPEVLDKSQEVEE